MDHPLGQLLWVLQSFVSGQNVSELPGFMKHQKEETD
jgi:hypothetical protein